MILNRKVQKTRIGMKRLAYVFAVVASLSAPATTPATAQTLTVLLPVISFPDSPESAVASPSTKGCTPLAVTAVCKLQE